jgi:hypothetical protein
MAVKRERRIPSPSMSPNPLIREIPKIYRIKAEVNEVICESQIAVHDLSNPRSVARSSGCHSRSASFIRSNMRIFASIASPIERITQAMEASVSTTQKNFTKAIKMSEYTINATPASIPDTL